MRGPPNKVVPTPAVMSETDVVRADRKLVQSTYKPPTDDEVDYQVQEMMKNDATNEEVNQRLNQRRHSNDNMKKTKVSNRFRNRNHERAFQGNLYHSTSIAHPFNTFSLVLPFSNECPVRIDERNFGSYCICRR